MAVKNLVYLCRVPEQGNENSDVISIIYLVQIP